MQAFGSVISIGGLSVFRMEKLRFALMKSNAE